MSVKNNQTHIETHLYWHLIVALTSKQVIISFNIYLPLVKKHSAILQIAPYNVVQ